LVLVSDELCCLNEPQRISTKPGLILRVKSGFYSIKSVDFFKSKDNPGVLVFISTLEVSYMRANLISGAFCQVSPEQVMHRIVASGRITAIDRDCLMQAALDETPLSADLTEHVTRLFDRLRMGLLKVVD
jgi:hypothetical protein